MTIIDVTITKHKKLWEFSWCKMSKGKHCSSDKHSIWSREPASEQFIHSLTIKVRSSHLKHPTYEDDFFFLKGEQDMHIYHIVRDTIRNPRNTVSSRMGAKIPVMPSKQAVLQ
jgi:hypothetical protein